VRRGAAPEVWLPERVSRAVAELRAGKLSPCPHCGRDTVTTSDGICADCWGSKGGHPMGWRKRAPSKPSSVLDWVTWLLVDWWWRR
jgi:hypothetical protein